jgi:hypothetical protein
VIGVVPTSETTAVLFKPGRCSVGRDHRREAAEGRTTLAIVISAMAALWAIATVHHL